VPPLDMAPLKDWNSPAPLIFGVVEVMQVG